MLRLLSVSVCISLSLGCGLFGKKGEESTDTAVSDIPLVFPDYVPEFKTLADAAAGADSPQDLDFYPSDGARQYQLWVINKRTEDQGGSVLVIHNADGSGKDSELLVDGNAWHFMSLPSAMAFSPDTTNWATSPEVTDANHAGGTFTGPSLWSGSLDVFAQPSGGNGSHLDMLHQSPNSMGIAHHRKDAYFVFDGYSDEIVRYDFKGDHGPGNDDHSDAELKRYSEVPIERVPDIPSHMVIDHDTNWMYIADTAKGRVLRMDVTSGTKDFELQGQFEPLAEYWQMKNEVWEVFAQGLNDPCGIDVADGLLYVSDNATAEIIAYRLDTGEEIGRLQTNASSLMGIKVGPAGRLFYVDREKGKVVRIDKG